MNILQDILFWHLMICLSICAFQSCVGLYNREFWALFDVAENYLNEGTCGLIIFIVLTAWFGIVNDAIIYAIFGFLSV